MNLLWLGMVFDSTVSITHCSIVCAQQMLNEPISEFLLCVGEGDNYPFKMFIQNLIRDKRSLI